MSSRGRIHKLDTISISRVGKSVGLSLRPSEDVYSDKPNEDVYSDVTVRISTMTDPARMCTVTDSVRMCTVMVTVRMCTVIDPVEDVYSMGNKMCTVTDPDLLTYLLTYLLAVNQFPPDVTWTPNPNHTSL